MIVSKYFVHLHQGADEEEHEAGRQLLEPWLTGSMGYGRLYLGVHNNGDSSSDRKKGKK